jgi:hypothetical protein
LTRWLPLGLAAALALVTALSIVAGQRNSTLLLVVTIAWLVSFTAFVVAAFNRRRLTKLVDRIKSVAPVVPSGLIAAPPVDLAAVLGQLRGLGFEVAGTTDTTFAGTTVQTWVLVEPSGEAWVESGVTSGPIVVFLSDAAAGRFIETAFPKGEQIDDPRLLAQVVPSSVADALTAHRAAVTAGGGAVRAVKSIDDYLAAEALHRERTGGMRIQAYLERVIRPATRDWGIAAFVALVCMGLVLFLPLRNA